ncbi:hypothetical protein MAR_015279 [Mya arenaria]|uniref:DUF6570 domain-containing protein n=1 Tax=Mya arenaria TaxID=6604 RepID=A0ABY7FGJ7_MYAAR|nr:hypothetical protein MAR_015279 [Mya arenaria]
MSVANGFSFKNLPDSLSALKPTDTEQRCCSLRMPFMQLKQLGVGRQLGIYGNTVNVPMNPSDVVSSLPRRFDQTETIHLLFKRRIQFKSSIHHETVRPKAIYDLTKYFIEKSDLYKKEGVKLNEEWILPFEQKTEVAFTSAKDLTELKEGNSVENKTEPEDTWKELNNEEQSGAGNKDTLLQNLDFTDDGIHALQIAPGENNQPIGLFTDTYAEEKSFPEAAEEARKGNFRLKDKHLPNSSTEVTCSGMIDKYCNRPEMLERVALAEYAAYFERRPPRVNETANEIDINIDEMEDIIPGMDILLEDGYRLKKESSQKDERQLMAESASFEQQYIVNQELIMKTKMKFQSTVDGIEDAMNIVTEEMID